MHWAWSPHSQYPGLHTGVELPGPGPGHGTELGVEIIISTDVINPPTAHL